MGYSVRRESVAKEGRTYIACPDTSPSFMFALTFLPLLGREFFSDLPEQGKKRLLVRESVRSEDMCLLAPSNLDDVC